MTDVRDLSAGEYRAARAELLHAATQAELHRQDAADLARAAVRFTPKEPQK